jgi:hemerythrin-like domain-containing protein
MKPIGPLMVEHRLIERMISLMKKELEQINKRGKADTDFLLTTVDFIRTYADRTHHGKEEDILFRDLAKKKMSQIHTKTMNELIEEHIQARKMVRSLVDARDNYLKGNGESLEELAILVRQLIDFYPAHIEKEDKHFFYPCLEYFSKKEQEDMLNEFWDFDKKLIHEKYRGIVEQLEKGL